ncbi:TonB family protein [Mucilaginibacter conchicola]|uniref:TonB family protein n=2 Tax=Mucilaginibacter conchicola TaxID=2303333 RepID=A0A372P0F5_9SPHI|nr:TonB family protein [Mucilaginibacter conchicola]
MYRINDYYMNGKLRLATLSSVDSLRFEDGIQGVCYEYFEDGKRKSIKAFNKGKMEGDAVSYYPNGGLKSIENYSPAGVYLKQFSDSTGGVLTDAGNGKWIKQPENAKEHTEGNVVNGKEDGDWKRYIGDSVYTITYKQGVIIQGEENLRKDQWGMELPEVSPSFVGGDAVFGRYLGKSIHYPRAARMNNVQGRVIVAFVVEKDGSLTGIKVLRGIGGGCDEEAVRVLSLSPKWVPGKTKGKPVRVQYSIPINFALQDDGYEDRSATANPFPQAREN